MKQIISGFVVGFALVWGAVAHAQSNPVISPTDYVVWSQPGTSLAAVQSNRYTLKVDGGSPVVATGIQCVAATPPATGFDCGVVNPAPSVGSHTMSVTYAVRFSSGTYSGESPAGNCAWDTGGNPTQAPSNFRFLRFIGGLFVKLMSVFGHAING